MGIYIVLVHCIALVEVMLKVVVHVFYWILTIIYISGRVYKIEIRSSVALFISERIAQISFKF